MINIAILGFGVVGSGTAEVLTENKTVIEERLGCEYNIKYTAKIIEGWFKLGVKELKDVEPLEKAAENKTDTKPKENYAGYDKEAYKKSLDEDYK